MIEARFDSDREGWTTGPNNNPIAWAAGEGSPGGALTSIDRFAGTTFYTASDAFLGVRDDYYGGTLSWDLRQTNLTPGWQYDAADLRLTGANGLVLVAEAGDNPTDVFSTYRISFDLTTVWTVDTRLGEPATEAQLRSVLADLAAIEIRGEFNDRSVNDITYLDNVIMERPAAPDPREILASRFVDGVEQWSLTAGSRSLAHKAGGETLEAKGKTSGQTWYFEAPKAYTGDKSAYSGGTLSFDLSKRKGGASFDDDDLILTSGATKLVAELPEPKRAFTTYEVSLDTETTWRIGGSDGAVATQAQIDAVLADLDSLRIRGDFGMQSETTRLDNVELAPLDLSTDVASVTRSVGSGVVTTLYGDVQQAFSALPVFSGNAKQKSVVEVEILQPSGGTGAVYTTSGNTRLEVTSSQGVVATLEVLSAKSVTLGGTDDWSLTGNAAANAFTGNSGANTLAGGGAADRLDGADGADLLEGDAGNDLLTGGGDDDSLAGGSGQDTLTGGPGADRLNGNTGHDLLVGGSGDDVLSDVDVKRGPKANGDDTLFGGRGADDLSGGDGNDSLIGGRDNDSLNGGSGRDVLLGGAGNDRLLAGIGDDLLDGGAGRDTYVFSTSGSGTATEGWGTDTVVFEDGVDVLRFNGGLEDEATSVAEFLFDTQEFGDVLIYDADNDGENVIVLVGVSESDLSAADFQFL